LNEEYIAKTNENEAQIMSLKEKAAKEMQETIAQYHNEAFLLI
jgi:hypothetical protein